MATPAIERLRDIKTLPQLLAYLRDELDWPISSNNTEEITFDYEPSELGLDKDTAVKIKEIKQLRPLTGNQPWGIFFVNFEKKRLPVMVMRRILRSLVFKKRTSPAKSDRQAWHASDLLFISAYGEEHDRAITFAHFVEDEELGSLAELRVLGWDDDDTPLKYDYVAHTLHDKFRWRGPFERDPDMWRKSWRDAFELRHREVITTSKQLALSLAALAKKIRSRVRSILRYEDGFGQIRKLQTAFRKALIHDLSDDDFADMYAQTITYGLFSAAVSRPAGVQTRNVVDMVPVTNPFLREMLATFLNLSGRKGKIDFDELGIQEVTSLLNSPNTHLSAVLRDFGNRMRSEDPVIHFYEDFLREYDAEKRIKRGVFYTPQPVVSYIVRSVHELLQSEFKLADGLADTTTWGEMVRRTPGLKLPNISGDSDRYQPISESEPFVQILDPAVGTATFLVEVIEVIYRHLKTKWDRGGFKEMPELPATSFPRQPADFSEYWNQYVAFSLLPRLHGFELMMAPYAIAHMKIGLKLWETSYRFAAEERAHIYLTNSLEPPSDIQRDLPALSPALAHEAQAVNEVKRTKRFTIVIGNPPYAGISANMTEYAQRLVDAYKIVDGKALNEKKLWLQDDYVKFIRLAQTELQHATAGILGYITNHSYLDNTTFRGMRQSLMRGFPRLRVLDLHGSTTKNERSPDGSEDKNVFDIRQGVAVCLASRATLEPAILRSDLWGVREAKYAWLLSHSVHSTDFVTLSPDSPYYFFEPHDTKYRVEYDKGWKINEAMPVNCAGFITARDHFVIDFDTKTLLNRIGDFADSKVTDAEIRERYFSGCGSGKYPAGDTRGWKVSEARITVSDDKNWRERVRTCWYRPFDQRRIYWAQWMVDWPRPEMERHMGSGKNCAFHVCRQSISDTWRHVLVSQGITDDCYVSNKSRERGYTHPLYLQSTRDEIGLGRGRQPNFSAKFLCEFSTFLNLPQTKPYGLPSGLAAEDIFQYAYAVFHSPTYRSRYAEFLKIDFPRLPLTGNLQLLRALAKLGGELVTLHLLESPKLDKPRTEFVGSNRTVEKVNYSKNTVWIDKAQTSGFRGVPEEVWNFHIGGYQVCEKWLKDRKGRTLSKDNIAHYHKIVIALSETIRLMSEIDKVIEKHGGWPGAFQTAQSNFK
jgi:predicted helicase